MKILPFCMAKQCAGDSFVRLQPKPAFVEKLVTAISTALECGRLYPGDARSLQGGPLHCSNCIERRVARGETFAFRDFLELCVAELPTCLRRNLVFHPQLINLRLWRTITTTYGMQPRFTIYTDASFDLKHGVRLCFVVLSDEFQTAGISAFTMAILHSMMDKETYIAHGESFAPLLCLHWLGERLRGSNILWFLDNLGIVSCLCKGTLQWLMLAALFTPSYLNQQLCVSNHGMNMWILKLISLIVVLEAML